MSDEFEILGDVRQPPARSREGKYTPVYEALAQAKKKGPAWVALVSGTKDRVARVRNAISRQMSEDMSWHTRTHRDEESTEEDAYILFVKYDKTNARLPRRPRTAPLAGDEALAEDDEDALIEA